MRLIKTASDVELLQKAIDISTHGHIAAMKKAAPKKFEYEIQAELEYVFRSGGSKRNGYPSIVGSGPNTCILHYTENNREMQDGELVLVDAGAEYGYFTGDITRTYPVSGKFTAEQKAVYEVVLEAQKNAIAAARPGNTFMYMHETAIRILVDGLLSLKLLQGTVDDNIERGTFRKYYMHRTGHWLGMDVHDTGKYRIGESWRKLEEGMVLTVEPGLYIGENDEQHRFRNIGIRIEDDILITLDGPRVLSAACPKEIAEIEGIQRLP
jgi:Xaa-Pro aminopeptidase